MSLAVVAIAKNEAEDLPAFLNHLLPWVDEIVIVDDASTDDTAAIVRRIAPRAKLREAPMDPVAGFAGQRNRGIALAESDWLLHMDIDERVTPELASEMLTAIEDDERNAFRYRRLNFFLHRPMPAGGWQHWNNPQLARRGCHRFVNAIHEQSVVDGGEERTGQLQSSMWHLNDTDYVERVSKNLRYMQMSGDEILQRGVKVRWYHALLHPTYRALNSYFLQGGFRTGMPGLLLALYTFSGTFNWWAYAWERQNRIEREALENSVRRMWAEREVAKDAIVEHG
jgi:glycosyltransferase involved in cell wall biosynthesis